MADTLTAAERRRIAEEAVTYANQVLREVDAPAPDDLRTMSLGDLLAFLESHGVQLDMARMEAEVTAAIGRDAAQIERGQELSPARMAQLQKRVAAQVTSQAVSVANQTIGDLRQAALDESDDRPEEERWGMWVSVNGEQACPDCRDLHGTVATMDAWEGIRPRDGHTLCGGFCACSIVPCGPPASRFENTRTRQG